MNIKQLQSFSRIVELGSQNRAAKSLNISESALSRQISQLESELGFRLFERDKIRLVPTRLGAQFCREVERVLSGFEQLPRIANELVKDVRQRFRLVAIQRLSYALAIPATAELQRRYTNLDLTIDIQPNRTLERRIRTLEYDLAIGPAGPALSEKLTKTFIKAPMVAVVPKNHALAKKSSLCMSDFASEQLALTAHESLMRQQVTQAAALDGVELASSIDVSETVLGCQFAAQGHAIAICDPFAPSAYLDNVQVIPITPTFALDFVSLETQNAHPLTTEFAEILAAKATHHLTSIGLSAL